MAKNESPAPDANRKPGGDERKAKHIKPGTKIHSVISCWANGKSINCFEAAREHHDYVLRSTVSYIQRKYDLSVCRKYEQITGYGGSKIRCCRYWLSAAEQSQALALLSNEETKD